MTSNITLYEKVNPSKLRYIVENIESIIQGNNEETEAQRTILNKYLKKVKKGRVKCIYSQRSNQGRYFVKGSMGLQGISKVVRHTISEEYYQDIDVKNAHPVLLLQYCQVNGISHRHLETYVANRESYLKKLNHDCGLDRETSKTLMLEILNGKDLSADPTQRDPTQRDPTQRDPTQRDPTQRVPDYLADFYNELITTRKRIMDMNPNLVKLGKKNLKKKGRSESNLDGTVTNLLMCNMENAVLLSMCDFFKEKNFNVGVLCFDGLMIEKTDLLVDSVLRECELFVKDRTTYSVELLEKPMGLGIVVPTEGFVDYDTIKERFEENNFKCIDQAGFFNTEHDRVRFKSKGEMVASYEHLSYINDDAKPACFIKEWFRDSDMRRYEFVRCLPPPLKEDKYTYNTWKGFQVEQFQPAEDSKGLTVILDHLRLLNNNDEKCFNFSVLWLASLFQEPARKNNIAWMIKTKQGMGKDLFYSLLEKMIGSSHCGNTSRADRDIFGDFNKFLKDKLLIVMNEFAGNIGYKYSDKLKDLITNIKEPIRKMRTDVDEGERSFAHYMFFTNNDFPIKIDKDDRRLFVVEVRQPIPSKEYFDTLIEVMNDPSVLRSFYDYLMSVDVSNVDWRRERPITEYMSELVTNSQDQEMSFLIEILTDASNKGAKSYEVPSKQLLNNFLNRCLENGFEYRTTATKFGIKISKYNIKGFTARRTKVGKKYTFDVPECIDYLIQENYLTKDFLSLENGDKPRRLLVNEIDEIEESVAKKGGPPM
jgi:hypothetical protein